MRRLLFFALGLLFGASLGGLVALLLTPASGDELRRGFRARVENARREAEIASELRRRELETQFLVLTSPKPREKK